MDDAFGHHKRRDRIMAENIQRQNNRESQAIIAQMRGEKTLPTKPISRCPSCGGNWPQLWCGTDWRCEYCFEICPTCS